MRRITRAIAEIESFRGAVLRAAAAWHSPTELIILSLLNVATTALAQVQLLIPAVRRGEIDQDVDRSAELIAQINDEMRDERKAAG